ncbi:DUF4185 domain-containing protein [Brachybacterium sacelli]|uniref:DUF4185 domain-containing protein n=1 Tax=Brachybacterium sacelli TaxID=173364 RepID=A0ABS4WZC9_9MICO|nr:DUF4185 domain-containing protein [Brachybacterium sacelli]MBP2381557.1 hypothetical protein [Brachybacterium sacelli]
MTDQRFSRRTLGAATAVGLTSTAVPALAAPPERKPVLDIGRAAPAQALIDALNRYGDRGPGWSGGDSTYSVPLTGRTSALIFSDTFLGPVAANGTRSRKAPFLNNSIVLTSGAGTDRFRFSTVTGHRDEDPAALVTTEDTATNWYWFGAGTKRSAREIHVMALLLERTGDGPFDFAWASTAVARLDAQKGTLHSLREAPSEADIQWASWIERIGPWLYVYGVRDRGADKRLFLARVSRASLGDRSAWRFWTGHAWSRAEGDAQEIASAVANEVSVAAFHGGYLLITQDTSVALNTQVVASWAKHPEGPFTEKTPLFTMDTSGTRGTQVYAYNAHEHPQWRRGHTVLVSYNVNSFDSEELYEDAAIYRPRFVRIPVRVRGGAQGDGAGRSQGR